MMAARVVVAAATLATMAPLAAIAQTAPAAATLAENDPARLVELIVPADQLARVAKNSFKAGFGESLDGDANGKAAYSTHPGMQAFVADRVSDEVGTLLRENLPGLREQLTDIVREEMEPDEIADTVVFFESPTGAKIRARVFAALAEQSPTTSEDAKEAATAAAVGDLTSEDYPALTAFGSSSAAKKMQIINPKMMAASRAWGQDVITSGADRLKAARERAEAQFLAEHAK
jgi:hypothetical protein